MFQADIWVVWNLTANHFSPGLFISIEKGVSTNLCLMQE